VHGERTGQFAGAGADGIAEFVGVAAERDFEFTGAAVDGLGQLIGTKVALSSLVRVSRAPAMVAVRASMSATKRPARLSIAEAKRE
jgi:hypothetical protein